MLSRRKHGINILSMAKKRRRLTIISHANSNESNIFNTSNTIYVKRTSIFSYSAVQNGISSNTLITSPKLTNT